MGADTNHDIEFIVRARQAPVHPERFLNAVGPGGGVEYLAGILLSALFVSQGHRTDCQVTLVLEKSADFSRAITFRGASLGSLPGLHEAALLRTIADALAAGRALGKDGVTRVIKDARDIEVAATSFEKLVKSRAEARPVFLLDPTGEDIRQADLPGDAVFVMTDHTPMPARTFRSMARQGVRNLSLGPRMLHASQCITLIHNEFDRRR